MKRMPTSHIPSELSDALREVGRQWALSDVRPRLDYQIKEHWDKVVKEWADSDLPLVIRKGGGIRGGLVTHSSGRRLVLADNSPAQWAFSRAYAGNDYSLSEIHKLFEQDLIPFAMINTADEKKMALYKCHLTLADNINKSGWKLCHSHAIGLNTKGKAEDLPIEILKQHFISFLAPSNHFLVPLAWAGMGEVTEVIEEVRKVDNCF